MARKDYGPPSESSAQSAAFVRRTRSEYAVSMVKLIVTIVFVLGLLSVVYAMVRAFWRLHTGDVEEAGSDGRTFTR